MTKAQIAEEKLRNDGWTFSHSASFNGYYPAGTVTTMQTRKGREWCRVHRGKTVCHSAYQLTDVYYRVLNEN